ncbi:MAG: methyltransferase domain-containing protein [Proteobacteria bacterium]|nr:methyltransferase domain-containing protein [Pseudomonadota bacterium]
MNKIKKWQNHTGPILDSVKGFDVIECEVCGFKHIIPIPTPEELEKLYEEEFYSTEKPNYFKDTEEDLEWWETTYRNYYQLFEKYCPKESRRLLEIGSGPGYFLKCGKELGWDVLGFEPSKQAYEYSQKFGISVVNEFFSENNADKYGKFDVVYMNTVIEHLPDPISLIKATKIVLNPNGIVCIIAPNDYNLLQNILRENLGYEPWWVVPHHHINYFDFKSIKKLLERLGFEIVESTGTFPMEFFLLSGDNYVGDDKLGRECHFKRKIFEANMYKYGREQLNMIYKALAKQGIGREFVVVGRKTGD